MDDDLKKVFFTNAIIMAKADGEIEPEEKDFIKKLITKAGISKSQVGQWLREARKNDYQLISLQEQDRLEMLLRLMIGIAATDKKLQKAEKEVLIQIGKANGLSSRELIHFFKKYWAQDNFEDIFQGLPKGENTKPMITLITDHFETIDEFIQAGEGIHFNQCPLKDIKPEMSPEWLAFHAADDKRRSLNMLERLKAVFPNVSIIAVVERSQAFQVSYLLDSGVIFCMVKPIYPNELSLRLKKEQGKQM